MSNLSQRFNNLSLYKKILLILSTTLLFVFFALLWAFSFFPSIMPVSCILPMHSL